VLFEDLGDGLVDRSRTRHIAKMCSYFGRACCSVSFGTL
jgi:hypothetical protein